MTKLILLFIAYSVVMAIIKKRAEKKAREQAAANGELPEDDDREDIEPEIEAPPEKSRTRVMKGKPFLMSGEAAENDELRRERPEADRREHERVTHDKPQWEKYKAERHQPEKAERAEKAQSAEKARPEPAKAANRGQSILDQLAKELGLPSPSGEQPVPSAPPRKRQDTEYKPTAAEGGKPTARPTATRDNEARKWVSAGTSGSSSNSSANAPVATVQTLAPLSSRFTNPPLSRPDDMASAMVVQAILGEAPGLRYWRDAAGRRRPPAPEEKKA
jgi:cbb3-type cytochrome oxidase subunit 3